MSVTKSVEMNMNYAPIHKFVHWLTALIILGMIPVGIIMTEISPGALKNNLYELHKSFGIIVLVLALVRLGVLLRYGSPAPEPTLSPLQRIVSKTVHHLIYLLLFIAPLSGFIGTSMCCAPVNLFWTIPVPPSLPGGFETAKIVLAVHGVATISLAVLVVMHVGAGMMHAVVLRDGVIWRMLPTSWRPAGR
jgi:cytochrome b561